MAFLITQDIIMTRTWPIKIKDSGLMAFFLSLNFPTSDFFVLEKNTFLRWNHSYLDLSDIQLILLYYSPKQDKKNQYAIYQSFLTHNKSCWSGISILKRTRKTGSRKVLKVYFWSNRNSFPMKGSQLGMIK